MVRRLLSLALALSLVLQPASSSLVLAADPVGPLDQGADEGGDRLSPEQFQQALNQEQQAQQFNQTLAAALQPQQVLGTRFPHVPMYSDRIARDGDFTAWVEIANDTGRNEPVTLLFSFTHAVTGATREIYKAVQTDGDGTVFDMTLTNQELNQNGIGPGRYQAAFVAFDANDQRIGEYLGDSLTIGTVAPAFVTASVDTPGIRLDGAFSARFQVGNAGDTADRVTLLTVITPAGSTDPADSREFSRVVDLAPGGGTFSMQMTAQELRAAGVQPGPHVVSFLVLDGLGNRVGEAFYGQPFNFGIPVINSTPPAYGPSIGAGSPFRATWTLGNIGQVAGPATLLTVITPAGSTNSADSREFYRTVQVPVGGGTFVTEITNAELDAAGITGGRYGVTFVAFHADDSRMGEYPGNPLTVGTVAPAFVTASVDTPGIRLDGAFSGRFRLSNAGDTADRVTLVTVITPAGSTNPADSREFSRVVDLAPGGGTFSMQMTAQELRAAGVQPGPHVVSFLVLDGLGNRVGEPLYGQPFSFGISQVSSLPPTHGGQVGLSDPFAATWRLGNGGDAPGTVTLLTVITPLGTDASREFYRTVQVPAGGGTFVMELTNTELDAAGITGGRYLVTFVAFDASDNRIGEYPGSLLTIGTPAPVVTAVPAYTQTLPLPPGPPDAGQFTGTVVSGNYTQTRVEAAGSSAALTFIADPPSGPNGHSEERQSVDLVSGRIQVFTRTEVGFGSGQFKEETEVFQPGQKGYLDALDALRASAEQAWLASVGLDSREPLQRIRDALDTLRTQAGPLFRSTWTLGNTGNAPDYVTLMAAVTPAGSTNPADTREFSQAVNVPVGGGTFELGVSALQLRNAGIGPGSYTVSFAARNGLGQPIGQPFFGNPLFIGQPQTDSAQPPTYDSTIGVDDSFAAQWTLTNTGPVTGDVTLLTVITPVSTGDPTRTAGADGLEPQIATAIALHSVAILENPEGDVAILTFRHTPPNAQAGYIVRDATSRVNFLTGQVELLTHTEFNNGQISDTSATFHPGSVGYRPALESIIRSMSYKDAEAVPGSSASAIARRGRIEAFQERLEFLLQGQSREFYRNVQVPVGGGTFVAEIINAELDAADLIGGEYRVSFIAFDEKGNRIGEYFGNPLSIGSRALRTDHANYTKVTHQVTPGDPIVVETAVINDSEAIGYAQVVATIRPLGGDPNDPASNEYASKLVPVLPSTPSPSDPNRQIGFRKLWLTIPNQMDSAPLPPGQYMMTISVLDAKGNLIGERVAGQIISIGQAEASFNTVPAYDETIRVNESFVSTWTLGNAGDTAEQVTLTAVITRAGTDESDEFSRTVSLPAGGGTFDLEVTAQQRQAAGITAGDHRVTFIAFNGAGQRIGQPFFGNELRIGEPAVTAPAAPLYDDRIGDSEDFTAQWDIGNSGPVTGTVTLLTVFTRAGAANSVEIYKTAEIPPGGGKGNVLITVAERATAGIGTGDYTLAFVAFDENDNRIGEFFGKPLRIGSANSDSTQPPAYDNTIGVNDSFAAQWFLTNDGAVTGDVALLTVITPVGTQNSREFYTTGQVPPGGGTVNVEITNAQLDAAGITGGRYQVSFVAFNENDERTGEYFGNPLQIGTIGATFTAAPTYDAAITPADSFLSTWILGNTGDTPDRVTLTAVITRAGTTNSKEFSEVVDLPAGGGAFDLEITAQQRQAAGIGAGDYLVTFIAFNGAGQQIGQPFFGNELRIGAATLTAPQAPVYDNQIGANEDFTAQWQIGNTGNVTGIVTLLTGFNRGGTSVEIYKTADIPPGGGPGDVLITAAERTAAGIGPGDYTLSFVAFDENDNRIGEHFGNPLFIGQAGTDSTQPPTYDNTIGVNDSFAAQWTLTNDGAVTGNVTLLTVFTPVGTQNSHEFYTTGQVPPGGGVVNVEITNAELDAAGITGGRYQVSFVAFNGNDEKIGEYFGNPLTIGTSEASFTTTLPAYDGTIGVTEPFLSTWTLGNTGDTADQVTLTAVITRAGTDESDEFSRTVSVPAGGGAFDLEVTAQQRQAAGIGAGDYLVTFIAFNGAGRRIGEPFFGNRLRIGSSELSAPQAPIYTDRIGDSEDFTAQWEIANNGPVTGIVTLLTVFNRGGSSIEVYRTAEIPPGSIGRGNVLITAADRAAAGIGPGDYALSFIAFDENDSRIGEFFGSPLFIGDAAAGSTEPPTYSRAIGVNGSFTAQWILTNSGAVTGKVTLLTVITPVGTEDSREFYAPGQVPPGGGVVNVEITNAQLDAAGITGGRYLVSFAAFNDKEERIGEYFGNLLAIGDALPSLSERPSYTQAVPEDGDFTSTWGVGNTGDVPENVSLVTVITPLGGTDSDSREFYKDVTVQPGGGAFDFLITAAQLEAAGIVGGRQLVTFLLLDGAGNRVGAFYGNRLEICDIEPVFDQLPAYTAALDANSQFMSTFHVGNTGDARDLVSLVIVITPVGTTNSKEFYRVVHLPPGGTDIRHDIPASSLHQAGIGPGEYTVSFLVLNGWEERVRAFFGNPLTIGAAEVTSAQAPAYSQAIGVGQDFTAQWTLGNTGAVTGDVNLLTVFTRAGGANSIELYMEGQVSPGGGTVNVLITAAELAAAGITSGEYTLAFIAFDANDQRFGEYFGKPLTIGQGVPFFLLRPVSPAGLVQGSNLATEWRLENAGPVTAAVTLTLAVTPAGSTDPDDTVEFTQNLEVPPGGRFFLFEVPASQLAEKGITTGEYTLAFVVNDGNGAPLGRFFGVPLDVVPGGTPLSFLFSQQIPVGDFRGLLETWKVDPSDPSAPGLLDRAFTYDQSLAALGFLGINDLDAAREILDALERLEAGSGRLSFVYATGPLGQDFPAVFSATLGRVGDALLVYSLSGDTHFLPMAERLAQTLLDLRDPATGLIRGGYDADGVVFPWMSTEHNLTALTFLLDLGFLTGDPLYTDAALELSEDIETHLWAGDHYLQGYQDDAVVLDTQFLGAGAALSLGDTARAEALRDYIEARFRTEVQFNGQTVAGYAPYHTDDFLWTEGTLFVGLLDWVLGRTDSAQEILDAVNILRDPASGGILYAYPSGTTTNPGSDAQFPSFPHVASTALYLLLEAALDLSAPAAPAAQMTAGGGEASSAATQTALGADFTATVDASGAGAAGTPAAFQAVFTSQDGSSSVQAPRRAAVSLGNGRFLFGLSAQDLAALNITPGMYTVRYLAFNGFGDLISDNFYSALVEFLLN